MQRLTSPYGLSKLPILIDINGTRDCFIEKEYFGEYLEK